MKFISINSAILTLTYSLALTAALPTTLSSSGSSTDLAARSPAPNAITVDGASIAELAEREPLLIGAALKVGLKLGARIYSNWRSRHKKREFVEEDLEERELDDELDARDVDMGVLMAMIDRSLSDDGVAASVNARDMEDVLERGVDGVPGSGDRASCPVIGCRYV
ncbi:hypothetical protein NMY22_g16222 [Coprinellus aureogranulatus]|nr:hypothetical protein NMY22_g16222 [Coprinellus aureogranulatus]